MEPLELIPAAQSGNKAAMEQLVEENSGLIWSVVKRFSGRGAETEDLYQLGCVGFLKAVEGFDPAFGTRFSTYAVPKIAGEIRRFLRDDGPVKVSRTLKELAVRIARTREQLTAALGREPTVSQIAAELGIPPEEAAQAELAASEPDSIQRPAGEEGLTLEDLLSDRREEELLERIALRQAIDRLDPRARQVILLRYFHGLTQERIAAVLGVSQVQISRMEKKALARLREFL